MGDWLGKSAYAKYSFFKIGDEISKFRLSISGYSGNAGDSLNYHNGMKFSTNDQDNDEWILSCAQLGHGAWWYEHCGASSLKGEYGSLNDPASLSGIKWHYWKVKSLKSVEMKIRRKF